MELLPFSQAYEDELIELWNRCMLRDQIDLHRFRNQVLYDENFDTSLCLLAMEEGRIVGFALGMKRKFPYLERGLEPERGWINVLFVAPESRGRGIGRALVRAIENKLATLGVKEITLAAYSPNYFFPGIDVDAYAQAIPFFEDLGYIEIDLCYSMCKDLHGHHISDEWLKRRRAAEELGYRFGPFQSKDALELLSFAEHEFGGGWKRNVLLSLRAGEAEDVITVAKHNDVIVGFAMRKIDGNPMRFGPIGIGHNSRNAGIGGILFEVKQQEMCSKGLYHLFFLSTDEPGRRFYERHGVSVYRTYRTYRKTMAG